MRVVDAGAITSRYAAALLCLRLLRALLANSLFVIVLVAAAGAGAVMVLVASLTSSVVLGHAWIPGVRTSYLAIAIAFVVALELVLVALTAAAGYGYTKVARGSTAAAWFILVLGVLLLVGSGVDLVSHVARAFSGPPGRKGSEILAAAQNLWPAYALVGLVYGATGLVHLVRDGHRQVMSWPGSGERRQRLLQVIGLPILPGDRRRVLRRGLALAALAFACEGFAFSTYFSNGSLQQPPDLPLAAGIAVVVVGWPVSAAVLFGLLVLAQWLWGRARRAVQPSLQESLTIDPRPPVLFLRSFADDQVSLGSARVPFYLRLMDPGITRHRLEELLLPNLGVVGPVIAIGNPRDVARPVGAGRAYLGDDDWQRHVLAHMARATAIVVSLSFTDGLAWELDQIQERHHLWKTLFLVPPQLTTSGYDIRMRLARAGLQVDTGGAAAASPQHVLACWSRGAGRETLVRTSRLSELDYEVALRLFLAERPATQEWAEQH